MPVLELVKTMKKRQIPLGSRFGKLTVIGYAESDRHGNQYLTVRCSCSDEKVKRMRATALTIKPYEDKNGKVRLPHRSCGCESKRAYQEYWDKRAAGIRKRVCSEIWKAYQKGPHAERLAERFNLPVQLIIAISRLCNSKRMHRRRFYRPAIDEAKPANEPIEYGPFDDDIPF
jgi:hypothetical protein